MPIEIWTDASIAHSMMNPLLSLKMKSSRGNVTREWLQTSTNEINDIVSDAIKGSEAIVEDEAVLQYFRSDRSSRTIRSKSSSFEESQDSNCRDIYEGDQKQSIEKPNYAMTKFQECSIEEYGNMKAIPYWNVGSKFWVYVVNPLALSQSQLVDPR